jgi:hypothetical protein
VGAAGETRRPLLFGSGGESSKERVAWEGRAKNSEERKAMRILLFSALALFVIASPAAALLGDLEPANNHMSTAVIQFTPSDVVTIEGGKFSLGVGGGDTDLVGIGDLFAGDAVTVSTTPLVDPPDFELPDTIIGLFDSSGSELCIGDDAWNNDLDNFPTGYGSLCRLEIPSDGDYFVGVTGFSPNPFDGTHLEEGRYTLTVTVTAVPEPGLLLQLASALLGLVVLDKRRRRANG